MHELSHGFSAAARTTDIHTASSFTTEDGPQYGAVVAQVTDLIMTSLAFVRKIVNR